MIKTYGVHDHWTDIAKKNDIDIMSVDGVIEEIKVNGEAIGGGGSSDFSTAEVTINWNPSVIGDVLSKDNCPMIWRDDSDENSPYIQGHLFVTTSPVVVEVPLYKGKCYWHMLYHGTTVTGNIEELDEGYLITGDCAITIS